MQRAQAGRQRSVMDIVVGNRLSGKELSRVLDFLVDDAYWNRWRTRDQNRTQFESAWEIYAASASNSGQLLALLGCLPAGSATAISRTNSFPGNIRGEGVGSTILEHLLSDVEAKDFRLRLHTADAQPLYSRFGFVAYGPTYMETSEQTQSKDQVEIVQRREERRSITSARGNFHAGPSDRGLTDPGRLRGRAWTDVTAEQRHSHTLALSWTRPDALENADMWAMQDESVEFIVSGLYRRSWEHAAQTFDALDLDSTRSVSGWQGERVAPKVRTCLWRVFRR